MGQQTSTPLTADPSSTTPTRRPAVKTRVQIKPPPLALLPTTSQSQQHSREEKQPPLTLSILLPPAMCSTVHNGEDWFHGVQQRWPLPSHQPPPADLSCLEQDEEEPQHLTTTTLNNPQPPLSFHTDWYHSLPAPLPVESQRQIILPPNYVHLRLQCENIMNNNDETRTNQITNTFTWLSTCVDMHREEYPEEHRHGFIVGVPFNLIGGCVVPLEQAFERKKNLEILFDNEFKQLTTLRHGGGSTHREPKSLAEWADEMKKNKSAYNHISKNKNDDHDVIDDENTPSAPPAALIADCSDKKIDSSQNTANTNKHQLTQLHTPQQQHHSKQPLRSSHIPEVVYFYVPRDKIPTFFTTLNTAIAQHHRCAQIHEVLMMSVVCHGYIKALITFLIFLNLFFSYNSRTHMTLATIIVTNAILIFIASLSAPQYWSPPPTTLWQRQHRKQSVVGWVNFFHIIAAVPSFASLVLPSDHIIGKSILVLLDAASIVSLFLGLIAVIALACFLIFVMITVIPIIFHFVLEWHWLWVIFSRLRTFLSILAKFLQSGRVIPNNNSQQQTNKRQS